MFMFTKTWHLLSALGFIYENFYSGQRKALLCQDHFKKLQWKTKQSWMVYYYILHLKDIIEYMKILHVSAAAKVYCWGHTSGCAKIWGYHERD